MSIATITGARRRTLSTRATTLYAVVTAISFSAATSAPTPLYHFYQQSLDLSPFLVTVIFGCYSFSVLGAFLTVSSLSDYVGRRPMILASLLLGALALVVFITARSAGALILARIIQGIANGIALTTLGATILDTDRHNGAIYNSVTSFIGLMVGSLLAGTLITFAPLPGQLVYIVMLVVTLGEATVLLVLPETAVRRPGALASLRPNVRVPADVLPVMVRLLPLNVATWALGGFYLSLMPALVAVTTGIASPFVGAAVVSLLMLTAAASVFALRPLSAGRVLSVSMIGLSIGLLVTLAGTGLRSAPLMIVGTAIAGIGFGAAYTGNLRILLPLADDSDRASLLAAYFAESYLAFSMPAIAAGLLVSVLGLLATAQLYLGVLLVFVALSAIATRQRSPADVQAQ
jgi:MFS family permease